MNCQSFEEIVNELARERLSQQTMELRDLALVHANECAACALRLREERALSFCLDEMAKEMKSFAAPVRVEDELLKAFRQRTEVRSQGSEIRVRWNRWLVAAAAVLLIVIGIGGLRRYLVRQSPLTGESKTELANPSAKFPPANAANGPENSSASIGNDSSGPLKNIVRRINPHARRPHRDNNNGHQVLVTVTNPSDDSAEIEVATQFMPLDYNGPINLQDGGQLVRVELSRSVMLNLGVPVNMDRYSERVKADVFVGADGLARAIRFVQ